MLLKPIDGDRRDLGEGNSGKSYYYGVVKDGKIQCSCGRSLVKLDEQTYRCSAGWPMYRFDDGGIIKDKFGNLMFKQQGHGEEGKDE